VITLLRIENLMLVERAELELAPGLNVVTGESGAGKSILLHGLELVLGVRPRRDCVRSGAREAWVEAAFAVPDEVLADGDEVLERARAALADQGELILARRVGDDGRTRAYLNGRLVPVSELRAVGERLIAFVAQHEHRRLAAPRAQLDLLDRYAGRDHLALRRRASELYAELRAARERLAELAASAATRAREIDLLRFELDEIEQLAPSAEEERQLRTERERLRRAGELQAAAVACASALASEDADNVGLRELAGAAEPLAAAVRGSDPELDALLERFTALAIEAQDLAGELRRYASAIESDPARLEQIESRLADYERVLRKHGGSVETALAHAEHCRRRLEELESLDESLGAAERAVADRERRFEELCAQLSARRAACAAELAAAVESELHALALPEARFVVGVGAAREPGPTGSDEVEFALAANPGMPPAALRDAASGGELARVTLALAAVAGVGSIPTVVFDEIDAGVGGHTAHAVGERLARVATQAQVLCVTHLPQVAARADAHFRVSKQVTAGRAVSHVETLADEEVVGELCRMLGADAGDRGARDHAQALRRAA